MYGITALGMGPLLYCVIYYCGDVYQYLTFDEDEDDYEDIQLWQVCNITFFIFLYDKTKYVCLY